MTRSTHHASRSRPRQRDAQARLTPIPNEPGPFPWRVGELVVGQPRNGAKRLEMASAAAVEVVSSKGF
jgi:hypothetical protein